MPYDEQELNKKLAIWSGWTFIPYKSHPELHYKINDSCWLEPGYNKQTLEHWQFNTPEFTGSLDACFKWLVPKLDHVSIVMNVAPSGDVFWNAHIEEKYKTANTSETPAMALCLAVSKLIDSKERTTNALR